MHNEERIKFRIVRLPILLLTVGVLLALILSSCGNNDAENNNDVGTNNNAENNNEEMNEVVDPTDAPPPDQSMYLTAWEGSRHNDYSIEHGPNTYCAHCHSPKNWDPEAFWGPPPNCFTCKFAGEDEELKIAPGNAFVEEEDWDGVSCAVCHEVDENGIVSADYARLNPLSGEYLEVNTPDELCETCHLSTAGNSFQRSSGSRGINTGGNAHSNFAMGDVSPPKYCTDCHDAHTLTPTECIDCHTIDGEHAKGKLGVMPSVTCMACHDADGNDVGFIDDEFTTVLNSPPARGAPASTDPIISHSINWKVTCDKCHFEGNPNGFTEYTAAGEVPQVKICQDDENLTVPKPDLGDYGEVGVDFTMGNCPEVEICKNGETLTVLESQLDQQGVVDVDYTLDACPEGD